MSRLETPTCPVGLERVPHVAVEVVVPCEEEAPALGEGDGGDPADDVVMGVSHKLLVRAEVEQPAGGIVRASGKRIAIRKELEGEIKSVCEGGKSERWEHRVPRAGPRAGTVPNISKGLHHRAPRSNLGTRTQRLCAGQAAGKALRRGGSKEQISRD